MNNNFDLSVSIVLFNNDIEEIKKTIKCVLNSSLSIKLVLIDNSKDDNLKILSNEFDLIYFHNNENIGFGSAHNLAFFKFCGNIKYHLFLNPDISFSIDTLKKIKDFLVSDNSIGVVMPKIIYPDGSLQRVARLSPSFFDLLIRRIRILKLLFATKNRNYELFSYKYDRVIDIPFLSGCFLFCRSELIHKTGGFDNRLFLYMEDVDFTRRVILNGFRAVVYPSVSVIHDHVYKRIESFSSFKVFFKSAFYYYNKWGWFFDYGRIKINNFTKDQIGG
jgi:GT2 family glycosyltransferase